MMTMSLVVAFGVVAVAVIAAPVVIVIVKTMKLEASLFLLVALKRRTQLV